MPFEIDRIRAEIARNPLFTPIPLDVAIAIVNDVLRVAGRPPVDDATWARWQKGAHERWAAQIGVLAWWLASTSLRDSTIEAMQAVPREPKAALEGFFRWIEPLTADMLHGNTFRQEELLRKWMLAWGGSVVGESGEESARRVHQLDYGKALAEYERAEQARRDEAAARAKALREAQEREAAARGWRE